MLFSTEIMEELEKLDPQIRAAFLKVLKLIEKTIGEVVKREDFLELKKEVELLTKAVRELAEAQKRTEQRVEELAEAQRRSEDRITRLEQVVAEIARELKALAREHRKTREILGNLTDTVGYGLEDKIMPYIPNFAIKEFGVEVHIVDRRNIVYPDGKYDEVNIYAEGTKDGQKVYIVGECKAHPGKKDLDRFSAMLNRLKVHLGSSIFPFVAGYTYSPEVEAYAKEKYPHIKIMKSFEFELKYK